MCCCCHTDQRRINSVAVDYAVLWKQTRLYCGAFLDGSSASSSSFLLTRLIINIQTDRRHVLLHVYSVEISRIRLLHTQPNNDTNEKKLNSFDLKQCRIHTHSDRANNRYNDHSIKKKFCREISEKREKGHQKILKFIDRSNNKRFNAR